MSRLVVAVLEQTPPGTVSTGDVAAALAPSRQRPILRPPASPALLEREQLRATTC